MAFEAHVPLCSVSESIALCVLAGHIKAIDGIEQYGIKQSMGTFETIETYCQIRGVDYPREIERGKCPVVWQRLYSRLTERSYLIMRVDDWSRFYLVSGEF